MPRRGCISSGRIENTHPKLKPAAETQKTTKKVPPNKPHLSPSSLKLEFPHRFQSLHGPARMPLSSATGLENKLSPSHRFFHTSRLPDFPKVRPTRFFYRITSSCGVVAPGFRGLWLLFQAASDAQKRGSATKSTLFTNVGFPFSFLPVSWARASHLVARHDTSHSLSLRGEIRTVPRRLVGTLTNK